MNAKFISSGVIRITPGDHNEKVLLDGFKKNDRYTVELKKEYNNQMRVSIDVDRIENIEIRGHQDSE